MPESEIVSVGFVAVEVIVMLPLTAPAALGVNETLNVALWPAPIVTGAVIPLKLNPVPLTATFDTETLDPPVFVIVSDWLCVLPTVTVPKLTLVGFAASVPGVTPVPDSPMVSDGFDASEVIVTVPLAAPADCGENATVNVVLCDAFSVKGVVIPLN